jgi:hypothetical protein
MPLKLSLPSDGTKNATVRVVGVDCDSEKLYQITDKTSMEHIPDYLKIDRVQYSIEKDTFLYIYWGDEFIFPLEARGFFDFHSFESLIDVDKREVFLSVKGNGHFFLQFDLTKVGSNQ